MLLVANVAFPNGDATFLFVIQLEGMDMISHNIEETEKYAEKFIGEIIQSTKGREGAVVVGLYGELGAGKTVFVKAIAKSFGLVRTVTSPTFVIEKIYKLENTIFKHLIHIDAYRLMGGSELKNLGWEDIVKDKKNIIFLEWPERVKEIIPDDMISVTFKVVGEKERKIEIKMSNF